MATSQVAVREASCVQQNAADNGVQESPEVIAMLAKLEDALDGNLEPSEWGGSSPPPRHVQHQQRPGGHTAFDARNNSGESGGWDGRQQHKRGAGGAGTGAGNERCVLEDFTQCSKSHLWKLMMSFYDRKGVESWSQGIVPHFITCNAFIGRSYAQVLSGFLRDCVRGAGGMKLDPTEPLYIIELGTGSGKFSFFMLKALLEMKEVCDFPVEKMVYVMTDFTESNFKFWAEHPVLKPFLDSGQLDMAIFDAVNDTTIKLSRSGVLLGPGTCVNPICVVANYLFDTLCHDIFQVDQGKAKEGLISVGSTQKDEPDPLDPEIIQRLDNRFSYQDIPDDYYTDEDGDEPHFKRILDWYVDYAAQGSGGMSILFPVGALRALRRLMTFSDNRAFVISGDKGNNNPEQFKGLMDPHIAVHGSFSVMVNYHSIGAYFTSRGGFALHNPQEEASLKVSTFVLTGDSGGDEDGEWTGEAMDRKDLERSSQFPHLEAAFRTNVEQFGPNDFFVMQKCMKEDAATPTLKSVVALLKLGDWDPDVFYKFRDTILNQVSTAVTKLKKDLCRGIPRVWSNYYMLDKDKDVAFEIGRFYYGIREYENALEFYRDSSESVGQHHVTFHNMGLCYYSMGDLHQAKINFELALGMNPNYEKAKSWQRKVHQELNCPEVNGEPSANGTASTTPATGITDARVPTSPSAEWTVPTPLALPAGEEADSPADGLPLEPPAEDLNTR
ncbi:unnamed protein product [Ectocarpus sp. CCAP 1310/34]|nr:unnamed protein product [Ectocarpus sp. CCAP 1310/34]